MTPMKKPLEVLRLYAPHDSTLMGVFHSRAKVDPDREFIFFNGQSWTWAQFAHRVERTASFFLSQGVAHGDRVAVMARNCDGHVLALLSLASIGAIMVPVNPEFGVEEAKYVLTHSEVCAVLASKDTLPVVRQAIQSLPMKPWIALLDEAHEEVPALEALTQAIPTPLSPNKVSAEDTVLIVYTSGTTGFPKGAMHSQANFVAGGEAFVQRVYLQNDDRVMVVLPMFHINANFYSLAGTLASGACLIIVPKFSASTFWQVAADTRATQTNIIEAIGTIIKNRPRTEYRKDHRLRAVYGVRANFADTFRHEFGIPHLIGGYGMTEIPGVTCNPVEGVQKWSTMGPLGRHPDPDRAWAQCRVVDENGGDVGVDCEGELWVKTPIVMKGYFRDPEQTKAAFNEGWFMTGDVVKCDAEGYYTFVCRKKDIIRRRGENISGAELDRVIGQFPPVLEVATVAVPADLGEDDILVAIVLKPHQKATAEQIALWCREHLAPQKIPRYILFVDTLPYTPTGKIQKAVLKADKGLKLRAIDLQMPSKAT